MKMKKILSLLPSSLFALFVLVTQTNGQENLFTGELVIENNSTSRTIVARIYPVSFVFNGRDFPINYFRYNLKAVNPGIPPDVPYNYINGRNQSTDSFTILSNSVLELNHDADNAVSNTDACVSYGKYKIMISWMEGDDYKFDTCTVEWDAGYGTLANLFKYDLVIHFRDDNSSPRLNFKWSGGTREYPITYVNKNIIAWDQQYGLIYHPPLPDDSLRRLRTKEYGNFLYDSQYGNDYTILPQDSRRDCGSLENQIFEDNRSGVLTLNLTIDKNVTTRDTLEDNPTNIVVTKKVILKIDTADIFNMITPSSPSGGYTNLIVQDSSFLLLRRASKIYVWAPNRITLKNKGTIILNSGAEIRIKPGAIFCNEGGKIYGRIIYEGGIHYSLCALADYLLQDSSKFILEENATLSVPNNTTLHLKGNTTSLIMRPNSKLMFGENSGIVCDSGAKLIANNATFTSIDSTKKWNGISLRHLWQDTIKNCTIKNATYGISIFDKYSSSESAVPYSTEISGCTFVNQTNYVLNSCVYLAGSNNVLIMNNTFTSNILAKGFTHAVYAEYCPEGDFNIIGNTINNSNSGMTLIQCSPYIARNTLNGNAYVEMGFFLDNSNGTLEYNVVNDFYYSYYSFYSSPNLLKNTFNNSYDQNIYLSSSSAPIMHPLVSEGSTCWFSGDNLITGSPSDAGIFFDEDAYPDMNYGYNRFILTNNTYYINGANPLSQSGKDFYVLKNYWDETPDPNKFNVANAPSVVYDPYDDNSQTGRATNTYTLYDIGFGLYDTVYINEPDNPGMVQELYLEAYQEEYSGKKSATISEFSTLQSYYANISSDTSYSEIQRNISEDFMIKAKVKQYNIEEATSDYNTIYNQNINTPKGIHALINKEILVAGAGDNTGNNPGIENLELSQIRINEILSNIIHKKPNILSNSNNNPESFSLSQNYPNPFNPNTVISYQLSVSSFTSLKIYDLLGKEVAILVNEKQNAGSYHYQFSTINYQLSSGVYYYRLNAGQNTSVKRMVLLK